MTSRSLPWPWVAVAAVLVLIRTWPYAWWGTVDFDADQAVVGLMAQHVAEFRAFPVYQYALSYVLMVSVYLTAPFMWVFGPTLFALKLPLVLLNVIVGVWLVTAVARTGVRPAVAVLLCLPVLMTAGVTNAGLMDALGMTVEPAVFVLALWSLRRQPLALGAVAAVGFHVREFVAYAVAALIAVDVVSGVFARRAGWHAWATSAWAALGVSALIAGLARLASVRGPETFAATSDGNLATLGGAFCFAPSQALANLLSLVTSYLGMLWGAAPVPLSQAAVQTAIVQGAPGAWPLLGAVLLIVMATLLFRGRTLWARRHAARVQLAAFLVLVATQAVFVYAISRCGPLSLVTIRYALLGMFLPTGLALALWAVAPPLAVRGLVGAAFIALALLNAWPHVRLWREQMAQPAWPNRAQLAAALEARGIRFIRTDYWTGYYVAFLTQERVTVGVDALSRVDAYERLLARHADQVVRVSVTPCPGGEPIAPGYHLCHDRTP